MDRIDEIAERYSDAVRRKDEAAFLSLYADDVVVFDMWDRWSYRGREAWSGMVKAWFGSLGGESVAVRFTPSMELVDGDWAIWGANVRYAGLNADGEELRAMENRISWSLRRTEGKWLIVHEHSSAPADFDTLKVMLTGKDA